MNATEILNPVKLDDASIEVFFLLMKIKDDNENRWSEFCNTLLYKNRFSVTCEVTEEIHKRAETASTMISAGTVLYRARLFNKHFIDYFEELYSRANPSEQTLIKEIKEFMPTYGIATAFSPYMYMTDLPESLSAETSPQIDKMKEIWNNMRFKGYNAKGSGLAPAERVPSGRANPNHVSYLYLSEDEMTSVYEIRPMIGEVVSVARFRVKKALKVYDFTKDFCGNIDSGDIMPLINTIGSKFSCPVRGNEEDYLPTQYLSEMIKNMGFDGIRFRSSLRADGANVVLFNDEFCKPFGSDLFDVHSIELGIKKDKIYEILQSQADNKSLSRVSL